MLTCCGLKLRMSVESLAIINEMSGVRVMSLEIVRCVRGSCLRLSVGFLGLGSMGSGWRWWCGSYRRVVLKCCVGME